MDCTEQQRSHRKFQYKGCFPEVSIDICLQFDLTSNILSAGGLYICVCDGPLKDIRLAGCRLLTVV